MSDNLPVIVMPPLGRALTQVWYLLFDLSEHVPGLEQGRSDWRPSADGDIETYENERESLEHFNQQVDAARRYVGQRLRRLLM